MEEKKSYAAVMVVLLTVLFLTMFAIWLKECDIDFRVSNYIVAKLGRKPLLIRFMFVVLYGLFVWLTPANIRIKDEFTKRMLLVTMVILGLLVIVGNIRIIEYDLIILPIIFFLYLIIATYAISSLRKKSFVTEGILGISSKESDFYFEFEVISKNEHLVVHKAQQNIWIDGGPGSGKSDTLVKSIIRQSVERQYAGFIYDWEGDPTMDDNPLLSRVAYGCIEHYKHNKLKFGFINFTDMTKTERINVLSELYLSDANTRELAIKDMITSLLINLNPEWRVKRDFWAGQAILYVSSIAYKCYLERETGIGTLAHVIAMTLDDPKKVVKWLSENKQIARTISSIRTAYENEAGGQIAGAIASAQAPMANLNIPNIFWVLSGTADNEFNLDITNAENPSLLCVGNSPALKEAVSPAISCITSVLMRQMNRAGKCKSVFLVDELPTVNLFGLSHFTSTARKHFVSTVLAVQNYDQLVESYGKEQASIVKGNCGSQFFGMTGSDTTAKGVQDLLGEIDVVSESFTTQDTGGGSESESLKKEKVMNARDIAGQKIGKFTGKIADGEPAFFSEKLGLDAGFLGDIPSFSLIVSTGNEAKDKEVMNAIVAENYERIVDQVETLLNKYK